MVSVCMATYNGAKYIRSQILSILSMLSEDDEIIVSDDGSTDNTIEILESVGDPRIKIYHNSGHHGVNGNFENSLRNAAGDVIFLSDQDDIWMDGKVKKCITALDDSLCVVHNAIVMDGNLERIIGYFFADRNCKTGFWHNWWRNGYLGCAMAFKRELLNYVLPIPENMPFYHDIWIGSIAQITGSVKFLDFIGIKYRRHDKTTSVTSKGSYLLGRKILYRLAILFYVLRRRLKII